MRQVLKNYTDAIPGGFHFYHPLSELVIGPRDSLSDLVSDVHAHELAQFGAAVTTREEVEAQVCLRRPEVCRPEATAPEVAIPVPPPLPTPRPPRPPQPPPPPTLDWHSYLKATKALARWMLSGRPKVSREEAAARASVCFTCPQHVPVPGCSSCRGNVLRGVVQAIVGEGSFPGSNRLQACGVCGCGLEAKVQLPVEFLRDREKNWPDHCWVGIEGASAGSGPEAGSAKTSWVGKE